LNSRPERRRLITDQEERQEPAQRRQPPAEIRTMGRRVRLPRRRPARIALGSGLVVGGILGFLPVLGFWMVPLGVAVLAVDVPAAQRLWRAMRAAALRPARRLRRLVRRRR
jgi:hypothetical protein